MIPFLWSSEVTKLKESEIISVVNQELGLEDGVKWGQEEHFRMLEVSCILIVVVITQLSIFTKLIDLYN